MPHHALRAGEDRVVVREHRAVRALFADQRAVDTSGARDRARRPACGASRSSTLRRPRCAAIASPPYSTKRARRHTGRRRSRAPSGDRLRGVRRRPPVGSRRRSGSAAERFGEIRTRLPRLLVGHPMSLGAPVSCRQCAASAMSSPAMPWRSRKRGRTTPGKAIGRQGAQEDLRVPAVGRSRVARREDPARERLCGHARVRDTDGVRPRQAWLDDDPARRQVLSRVDLLRDWIDESYAAVAPATLVRLAEADAIRLP